MAKTTNHFIVTRIGGEPYVCVTTDPVLEEEIPKDGDDPVLILQGITRVAAALNSYWDEQDDVDVERTYKLTLKLSPGISLLQVGFLVRFVLRAGAIIIPAIG